MEVLNTKLVGIIKDLPERPISVFPNRVVAFTVGARFSILFYIIWASKR